MAVALWHEEVWEWGPVELQMGLEKALAVTFLYKNIHNIFFLNQTGTHNKFCMDCLPCLEKYRHWVW